jgi:hypothetical protein
VHFNAPKGRASNAWRRIQDFRSRTPHPTAKPSANTTRKATDNSALDNKLERPHVPIRCYCRLHLGERLMTETQGWIAIVLLLLILAQLVIVGSEMRGLRKNFTSRIDALYQKLFGTD